MGVWWILGGSCGRAIRRRRRKEKDEEGLGREEKDEPPSKRVGEKNKGERHVSRANTRARPRGGKIGPPRAADTEEGEERAKRRYLGQRGKRVLGGHILGLGSLRSRIVKVVVEGNGFSLHVLSKSHLEFATNSHDFVLRGSTSPNSETIGLLSHAQDSSTHQALLGHRILQSLSNTRQQSINPTIIERGGALLRRQAHHPLSSASVVRILPGGFNALTTTKIQKQKRTKASQ